jgi:energy-coupling factor transporter ATP-binding protein EcfA2
MDTPSPSPAEAALLNKGARWNEEEDKALREAYQNGATSAELAEKHGRSKGAILSRLHKLDLISYGPYTSLVSPSASAEPEAEPDEPDHSMTRWNEQEVLKLLTAHHTFGTPESMIELAAELGRTPRALVLKLAGMGVVEMGVNPTPTPPAVVYKKPKTQEVKPPASSGKSVKISVTPEFQAAWKAVEQGENLLVLGSAGTGKSTFLRWLKHKLNGTRAYAVVAPTGMAALNVGGQTIHSFFGLKPQLLTGKNDWHKPRNPKVFEKLKLLVIDEISMVRADVFSAMEAFLRTFGPRPGKPFGGVQIVAMGDIYQLPPVVRGDEASFFSSVYETPFFFSSPAWEEGNFGLVEFTHVFRQEDEPFVALLNAIRHGQATPEVLAKLNSRLTTNPPTDAVILAARNRTVDAINQDALLALPGLTRSYMASVSGNMDPDNLTTPVELMLKKGARVMFTRNDVNGRWVNGSLGTVIRCDTTTVTVTLDETPGQRSETYIVEPAKWEATRYVVNENEELVPHVAGTFSQLPLTLAWAVTIHKAQGQTLPKCVLNLDDGGTFAEGQLYVALSRAKSLEGLYLTHPIQRRHVRVHPAILGFMGEL